MPEHELWLTALFNDYIPGIGLSILQMAHQKITDPARPWANWIVMELLVVVLLMLLTAIVRSSLSVDKPGALQHLFEVIWQFIRETAAEVGIPHSDRYAGYFGTVFIFIAAMNLIGVIPTLESPTATAAVPLGLALCTFIYYNFFGFKEMGVGKYLAHFAGPIWWLAPLMIPIEIVSHLARPVSLTARLFGNVSAGEQVTNLFIRLTYIVLPVIFMALHVFVALLQAYVFTLLSMMYVSFATAHDEEDSFSA